MLDSLGPFLAASTHGAWQAFVPGVVNVFVVLLQNDPPLS